MHWVGESRVVLLKAVIIAVMVGLFGLSLAMLLVSRTGDDPDITAATLPVHGRAATTSQIATAMPRWSATAVQGPAVAETQMSGLSARTAEPTATTPPAVPTATTQPSATTTPTALPPTATARSSAMLVRPQTSAPASTPTVTMVEVAALDWPGLLPDGMVFAAEDSWPFRTIAPDRENEPFLIFRGGSRWLLIRNQAGESEPIPRSATTQMLQLGGTPAMLVKYLDGGFKLILTRGGRTIQMSGQDLADEEIIRTATSLRPLSREALLARLTKEAAGQKFHVTLLWPSYLPKEITLAPAETIAQIAQPAGGPQADGYRVSFKGPDALIQVGGGTVNPPDFLGTTEQVTTGSLAGRLTVADRRYLLVVDVGASSGNFLPRFPVAPWGAPRRLPLVQQGRVFIAAENIDREQFDRVVANLIAVRPQDFVARARGQNTAGLTYLWPSTLPNGYSVDLSTVRTAWDDFLLQGGLPFFQLTATGPGGDAVTIKGGRENSGQGFVVPEGGDVERTTASIHGRIASVARTADGSNLFWSENDSLYAINSRSLLVEQLIVIGEGLQPIDADDFYRRIR